MQTPLQLMGYHSPVSVKPQFQRRSCKGRTKPPWNISIKNADTKSSLFPCVPGLFLFTAFRSSPLWIREPWKCLNVSPQPKIVVFRFVLFWFFFFLREDLNLGVHRTGIAMPDLLLLRLYLHEKYTCWIVWRRNLCSIAGSACKMQTTFLASPWPVPVLWKTWGYLVCLEVLASALSFSPGIRQVSMVRGFLLMLVWGKSSHLPSQDSQLHLAASAMITDHTQRFHSADRAEEKRMGGLLSSCSSSGSWPHK